MLRLIALWLVVSACGSSTSPGTAGAPPPPRDPPPSPVDQAPPSIDQPPGPTTLPLSALCPATGGGFDCSPYDQARAKLAATPPPPGGPLDTLTAARCGGHRLLRDTSPLVGYTRFYDATGALVAVIANSFEWGRSTIWGVVPTGCDEPSDVESLWATAPPPAAAGRCASRRTVADAVFPVAAPDWAVEPDCAARATTWANVPDEHLACTSDADCAVAGGGCKVYPLRQDASRRPEYAQGECTHPGAGACVKQRTRAACVRGCCTVQYP